MSPQVKHTKVDLYNFFFANKTRKTYTHLGISLGLIIILLAFALRPTILTISTIKEKITTYKTLNEKLSTKINASRSLQNQIDQTGTNGVGGLKNEIAFLNEVFQDNENLKDVYRNLHTRAVKHSVALKSITPKPVSATSNSTFDGSELSPSLIAYEMNIEVEAKDIIASENFLRSLEGHAAFPIPSRVRSVVIANLKESNSVNAVQDVDGSGNQNIVTMNITMIIYLDGTRYTVINE